jgi:hypothetical protein
LQQVVHKLKNYLEDPLWLVALAIANHDQEPLIFECVLKTLPQISIDPCYLVFFEQYI